MLIQPHPFFQHASSSMFLFLPIIFTPGSTFSLYKLDTKCITFTTIFLLPQPPNLDELNYLLSPIFICQLIAHFYPYTFRVSNSPVSWGPLFFKISLLRPLSHPPQGPNFHYSLQATLPISSVPLLHR